MIAVVPIRAGLVPAGAEEAISEAGGNLLLIGSGIQEACATLESVSAKVWTVDFEAETPETDTPGISPSSADQAQAAMAALAVIERPDETIILPASPDGRDLGPHLARILGRQFFAGAVAISDVAVSISRFGGLQIADFAVSEPIVATIQVGCRGPEYIAAPAEVIALPNTLPINSASSGVASISVLPPDAATMDLSEAPRIIGGGAGLRSAEAFSMLENVATVLDASMGVTRVITDRSWASHERQIGTTGVVVNPRLYISFGISGAVQHTSGLGQPDHIISVNTDPHCPMMQMSDLAIVSDANSVLEELAGLLDVKRSSESVNRAS